MPEGDTLFKIARTLHAVLAGKALTRVRSTLPRIAAADLVGHLIPKVEARGKNLLVHLDDGRALWTHLKMSGSWHVYRAGEKWQRPERQMRLALDVHDFCAVCFNAPLVELLSAMGLREERMLQLGPDGSAAEFDADEAFRRLRALSDLELGEALVRQHALAGLGNVFKSEMLFMLRLDPFMKLAEVDDARLTALVALGRKLLLDNRYSPTRITRRSLQGEGSRWVYGRQGEPCRKCGVPIEMQRQGQPLRSTYFCPACQLGRLPASDRPSR